MIRRTFDWLKKKEKTTENATRIEGEHRQLIFYKVITYDTKNNEAYQEEIESREFNELMSEGELTEIKPKLEDLGNGYGRIEYIFGLENRNEKFYLRVIK